MKKEDPNFVPPTSLHAKDTIARLGNGVIGGSEKRPREDRMDEDERESKREKTEEEDDGEEMEIEDDEEPGTKGKNGGLRHPTMANMVFDVSFNTSLQALFPLSYNSLLLSYYAQIYRRR